MSFSIFIFVCPLTLEFLLVLLLRQGLFLAAPAARIHCYLLEPVVRRETFYNLMTNHSFNCPVSLCCFFNTCFLVIFPYVRLKGLETKRAREGWNLGNDPHLGGIRLW